VTASHDNHQHKSILGDVARHERELLAKLEASQDDARKTVERARVEAAKHLSDEAARIQSEVSAARTRAELLRLQAFENAVAKAEQGLQGARQSAMSRVAEMTKQVSEFFLPKGGHS